MHKFNCDNKCIENCLNTLDSLKLQVLLLNKNKLGLSPLDISEYNRYINMNNSTALQFALFLKQKYHTKINT